MFGRQIGGGQPTQEGNPVYGVVTHITDGDGDMTEFVKKMNEKLARGWTLQGGVCYYPIPDETGGALLFCQAIVR